MSYGAFVKLEPGIEGLVHISEMSWTKRINHPSELVSIGDQIEVQVLNINKDKQEISLGMKQVQPNPWDKVAETLSAGHAWSSGTVRNLTNYGAFIEIEEGIDGLLHVSDMSWVRKVGHPSEVVEQGRQGHLRRLSTSIRSASAIALGLKQMANDPWEGDIPGRYHPGEIKKGKVTKLTNFGVFVELEPGLEGLAAHLRAGRPQGREPGGGGQGRRRDRGQGAARRCGRPQDRPEPSHSGHDRGRRGRGPEERRRNAGEGPPSRTEAASCAAARARAAASCSACPVKGKRARRSSNERSVQRIARRGS